MSEREILVGVISDTHGLLRPEAVAALQGSDMIIHAGDIGPADLLVELGLIAPVFAVLGNVDPWSVKLPLSRTVEAGEAKIYVIHDLAQMKELPSGVQCVVSGHSHKPSLDIRGGVFYLNPGSAGPRRFKLPVSAARIRVRGGELEPELLNLL